MTLVFRNKLEDDTYSGCFIEFSAEDGTLEDKETTEKDRLEDLLQREIEFFSYVCSVNDEGDDTFTVNAYIKDSLTIKGYTIKTFEEYTNEDTPPHAEIILSL